MKSIYYAESRIQTVFSINYSYFLNFVYPKILSQYHSKMVDRIIHKYYLTVVNWDSPLTKKRTLKKVRSFCDKIENKKNKNIKEIKISLKKLVVVG